MSIINNFTSYITKEAEIANKNPAENMVGISGLTIFVLGCIALFIIARIKLSKVPSGVTNRYLNECSRSPNPFYDATWHKFQSNWRLASGPVPMVVFVSSCVLVWKVSRYRCLNPNEGCIIKINDKFAQNKTWNEQDFTALQAHMAFVNEFAPLYFFLEKHEKEIADRVLGAPWKRAVLSCVMAMTEEHI